MFLVTFSTHLLEGVGVTGGDARRASAAQGRLARSLGLWASIGVVIGITIGSGIFRTPGVIAGRVPDPPLMLAVWVLGGLLAVCGALSVAELAAALPQTGGLYVYLREGWGRLVAFLFGWAELTLIRASSVGAVATVFAEYLLRSLGFDPAIYAAAVHYLAAGAIVFAVVVNVRSVRQAAALVGTATVAKYGALVVLVCAACLLGGVRGGSLMHFLPSGADVPAGAFGLALISVLWAYDGFMDLSFAGGEVKDPQRNLPRALILGVLAIIVIYLLTNAAYLLVVPIHEMARSPLIAADTMLALVGVVGVAFVSLVVMISTFGTLNAIMLSQPRIFFAMADDGLLFRIIARVHPRFSTPHVAIVLTGALGVAFVLTRTFEQLADTFVLAIWPFYALSVAAVYQLRWRRPNLERPYRVVGYPVTPLVFIAGALYLIANALLNEPRWTGVVFAIILVGVPVYWLCFGRRPGDISRSATLVS